jgi:flagellar biosynthesis/type III secretory pathway chaperone
MNNGIERLQSVVDRLVATAGALCGVLDQEAVAAREGDSTGLHACFQRKVELTRALEGLENTLREVVQTGCRPSDHQTRTLIDSDLALKAAAARNERALRGCTEGVRRIFESAARVMAAEDIGYGPARLAGEAGLFDSRAV